MNITMVWDNVNARGDWQVKAGRITTGQLLRTAVIISLFTDRRVPDNTKVADPAGWWDDTLSGVLIGSDLHLLRRRKIANRQLLIADAKDMIQVALQWLITSGIVSTIDVDVQSPPGTLLEFNIDLTEPAGPQTSVRLLWSVV